MDDPFFSPYGEEFWKENGSAEHREAERAIANELYDMLQPKTVVDIGCGTGQMLQAFADRGVKSLLGVESQQGIDWTQKLGIQEVGDRIHAADLRGSEAIPPVPDVDLVLCVEVAEHLPEEVARKVVGSICYRMCPAWFAFSGAVPHSPGGTGHINEQYFPYWKSLVESFGTHVLDRDKSNEFHRAVMRHRPMFYWAEYINLYKRI